MTFIRELAILLSILVGLSTTGCLSRNATPTRLSLTLPFGAVDPIGEPTSDGTLTLTGWVLSDDSIQAVSFFIDGRYVTSARLFQPRPDVNRAYPAYGVMNAGWKIEFDTRLFKGEHELLVQARTAHGAVRDLGAARRRFPDGT